MDGQRLPISQRLSYGFGHVLNDLCASMWFSYLLVFLHYVVRFSNGLAGNLMLLGQVADAIATPCVGLESDRTSGFGNYGKRKSWHLFGSICVILSFPFLFMQCIGSAHPADWALFIYYAPFVVIFQIGWASTQISHLSLIPAMANNASEKVELNAIRYAFTIFANISVYVITWLVLHFMQGKSQAMMDLDTRDAPSFRLIGLVVVGIGVVFTVLFHIGTKEKKIKDFDTKALDESTTLLKPCTVTWKEWLKEVQFYQVALLYMSTRLIVNISQVYFPMYLKETVDLEKTYIAIGPLVVFVSGFLASFVMKPVNNLIGRKITYILGLAAFMGNCVWLHFLKPKSGLLVLAPAILQGLGGSTLLITSLSMTADLIGQHTESSAFVYGAMSFTDKLSNGVAVVVIQHLHPCVTESCCPACHWFYRITMTYVPGGCVILAFVILLSLVPVKIGLLKKHGQHEALLERQVSSTSILDQHTPQINGIAQSVIPTVTDNETYQPIA